jgi:hypothetical protein
LRNLLAICQKAYGHFDIRTAGELFGSRANTPDRFADPAWQKGKMAEALDLIREPAKEDADLVLAVEYFKEQFPYWDNRLQGSISAMVSGILDRMRRPPLADLFGGKSTFAMADILNGKKICIVAMPVLGRKSDGISQYEGSIANGILQFCFLRAAADGERQTNSFLICDECQYTVSGELERALSVLREYRVATVLLTQQISGLDNRVGESRRDAILGTMKTKVFLQQTDAKTRQWASEQIGKVKRSLPSEGTTVVKGTTSRSENFSAPVDVDRIPPLRFSELKGGPENKFMVESIILKGSQVLEEKWHQKEPGTNGTVGLAEVKRRD